MLTEDFRTDIGREIAEIQTQMVSEKSGEITY